MSSAVQRNEHIPAPQCDVAAALFEAVTTVIGGRHLSFGGGTVLAARWNHRQSIDVELFCEPTVYGRLTPRERSMYQGGVITVRDAYDLAAASKCDLAALARACEHTSPRVLSTVSAVIVALPHGWSADDAKSLIEPQYRWPEGELRERVLAALRSSPAHGGEGRFER